MQISFDRVLNTIASADLMPVLATKHSFHSLHVVGFCCVLVVWGLIHLFALDERFNYTLLDHQFRLLREIVPQPIVDDVVVVGFDETTVVRYPEPLALWHKHLGLFFAAMAEGDAKVVGLDLVLPDRSFEAIFPGYDKSLLQGLIKVRKRVVLAETEDSNGSIRRIYPPYVSVVGGLASVGSSALPVEHDRVARFFSERLSDQGKQMPALTAQIVRKLGVKQPKFGLINYAYGAAFNYVPFHSVLDWYQQGDGATLKRHFSQKVVLLGAILPLIDRHYLPLKLAAWEQRDTIPGVLIQAQILRNLIAKKTITLPHPIILLLLQLLGVSFWFIGKFRKVALTAMAFWVVMLPLISTSLLYFGWFMPIAEGMLIGLIALLGRLGLDVSIERRAALKAKIEAQENEYRAQKEAVEAGCDQNPLVAVRDS